MEDTMGTRYVSVMSGAGFVPLLGTFVVAAGIVLVIGLTIGRLFRRTQDSLKNVATETQPTAESKISRLNSSITPSSSSSNKQRGKSQIRRKMQQEFHNPRLIHGLTGHTIEDIFDMLFPSNSKYLGSCDEEYQETINAAERRFNVPEHQYSEATYYWTDPSGVMHFIPSSYFYSNSGTMHTYQESYKNYELPQHLSLPFYTYMTLLTQEELRKLSTYMLKPEELHHLGFPVESTSHPGKAIFVDNWQQSRSDEQENSKVNSASSTYQQLSPTTPAVSAQEQHEKICSRCHKKYYVNKQDGDYVIPETCVYHWGKKRFDHCTRKYMWTCCYKHADEFPGCDSAPGHVWNGKVFGDNGPFDGYIKFSRAPWRSQKGNYGIYALDCEMYFTRNGLELGKITVLSLDNKIVYDTYVQPEGVLLDYNTRFSGITAEHISTASKTIKNVQADLTSFIYAETILIGHSLHCDLISLRIIHNRIIDTSILFSTPSDKLYRPSLVNLANTFLNKNLQNERIHDSIEDAQLVAELISLKLERKIKN